jgi:hypothetical protein
MRHFSKVAQLGLLAGVLTCPCCKFAMFADPPLTGVLRHSSVKFCETWVLAPLLAWQRARVSTTRALRVCWHPCWQGCCSQDCRCQMCQQGAGTLLKILLPQHPCWQGASTPCILLVQPGRHDALTGMAVVHETGCASPSDTSALHYSPSKGAQHTAVAATV